MLKIYQFNTCPFCYMVVSTLNKLKLEQGVDYELIEARRGTPGRAEVEKLGGRSQVPFMVDGDIQMYESADIIDYIKKKFAQN